ncbi:spore photoproduct lyase [Motilibacter peucedani]|uniref:Spore photoproduct lyase n=1 Tax=Motilibacter peucedani TaxID=598650 RepID=A0A420XSQ4_9ACTN|nr:radical SAM protein [Motilibacter peucedani]RKS77904.1 spore photoproduct lyase [Motilibacter peucedani]
MTHDSLAPVRRRTVTWTPKRAYVTASAYDEPHGRAILARLEAAGVPDIEVLRGDRLPSLRGATERETYARAKSTLAVVTSAATVRKPVPIPPSADWSFPLAQGCPGHCQYCYLAGSLTGPPVTRVYADLPRILAGLDEVVGHGEVTSGTAERGHEGTTFEASCYTDPLAIEHLTGSLAATVEHFGTHQWAGPVQLRLTTKYDAVEGLLGLDHRGRTRIRASVNVADVERFEGGTARVVSRYAALRSLALAGYPVGLTIAPIMPVEDWRAAYAGLLAQAADALGDVPGLDLTVECITHRFTPRSREVQLEWYPRTALDLDPAGRTTKRGKFGAVKHVYDKAVMSELRGWFTGAVAEQLPAARLLYWT